MDAVSVLDFVGIPYGGTAHEAIEASVSLARSVEQLGYRRIWFSEHHNSPTLACTAPELLIARVGAATTTLRVGAGGIMLPNHAPLKVAETFRTLEAMFPGRIDLGLGRAPGTDGLTALALRGSEEKVMGNEFPQLMGSLLAFLTDGFPSDHPFAQVQATPVVPTSPELWVLGSSEYGARFAAVNGLAASFAHQINPELAGPVLRAYRRDFRPSQFLDAPRSSVSTIAFASEDAAEVDEFAAFWTLNMAKLRSGRPSPTSPEEVKEFAASPSFPAAREAMAGRLTVGPPDEVVSGLKALLEDTEADELIIATPAPDYAARLRSYELLAGRLLPE
ncbi:LLM class flavin-dependent oxidoreductase [Cryptosporangium phraense]|uniref:LLM class flavin-dependent oxidoreductase n=1 Tax=Cryptosporangium phraense TaxID=2593070 RepID=A0A545AS49_9ACTN|nr:LLM class flavin-dependent oxidoreductase [Cryptosporangium phraense]TQS44162.1 LLM class flavin-dependent oxidoreductase [Cryptosporangium phraense]